MSAGYNYRKDYFKRTSDDNRTLFNAANGNDNIAQHIFGEAFPHSHIANLSLAWKPTTSDRFEISGGFNNMAFPRTQDNRTIQSNSNSITKDYTRYLDNRETKNISEAAAAYTHTFDKDKSLLIDITHSLYSEVEHNNYTNTFSIPKQDNSLDNTLIRQKHYENLMRAIYMNQLNKQNKLVLGYEGELDKNDMRYYAEDYVNNSWIKNSQKSNDFLFHGLKFSLRFL